MGPAGAAHLAQLTNLTWLDVEQNALGPEGAAEVAKLSALRLLYISKNEIGAEGAAHLAALKSLIGLSMGSNQLDAAGVIHLLMALTNLRELKLMHGEEEAGVMVEKALPNVDVMWGI